MTTDAPCAREIERKIDSKYDMIDEHAYIHPPPPHTVSEPNITAGHWPFSLRWPTKISSRTHSIRTHFYF